MHDRDQRNAWFKSTILVHEPALRRYLRRMSILAADIDDIVAEALARTYVAADWPRIDLGRSYLFTIARNLLTDAARRKAVVSFDLLADLELLNIVDRGASAEDVVTARDELRRLQTVIDSLPPQCRRVFILRRVQEKTPHEIAAELGLSVSTVGKHLTKAIALVTEALAEHQTPQHRPGRSWRKVKETR